MSGLRDRDLVLISLSETGPLTAPVSTVGNARDRRRSRARNGWSCPCLQSAEPTSADTHSAGRAPIPAVPEPELPPVPLPDPLATPGPDPVPNPLADPLADTPSDPFPDPPADSEPQAEPITPPEGSDSALPPPPEPPEVSTTSQGDDGNLNVSVRVESPGTEAPVDQHGPADDVVSPLAQPDITAPAGTAAPDPAPGLSQTGSTNTNVSVRVLSPGDNGPVSQTNASALPADGAGEASQPPSDASQYQDANSQYQSPNNTSGELVSSPDNRGMDLDVDAHRL